MGSCVSHCSRQDVVHQQIGSVISSVQKSIEVTSADSTLLQKSISGVGSGIKVHKFVGTIFGNRLFSPMTKKKVTESNDVRDQINTEIRALREQLARSQVLFTYLLKNSTSENAKTPDGKNELCALLQGGTMGDALFQCKSLDGQVLARFYNRSNRSSSSYASNRSTPLHCGYSSLSCPTLPIDFPVVTKSTQTEPLFGTSFYISHSNTHRGLSPESTHSLNKGTFFSPPTTPCETIPESIMHNDVCEVHREPEDHLYTRHRTNSFLSAVNEGNPKLVDFGLESTDIEMKQMLCDMNKSMKKSNEMSHFLSDLQTSSFLAATTSQTSEMDGRNVDENKECAYPRKLSILLEEDYEDASGNLFSVCNPPPYVNRRKKFFQSCNAKTQTDFTLPANASASRPLLLTCKTSSETPVIETCFPRRGYTIVSQAVKKKTIHSIELPKKLILRYPPPYTKNSTTRKYNTSSGDSVFQELQLKHKNNVYNWSAVGEYFLSKSPHNLIPSSKLQTRHLSLEKQESFSSCDYSFYPDSHMSSVTDFSGWITKSDIDLHLQPEPPSYQQSIFASQRSHSPKNSKFDGSTVESNPLIRTTDDPRTGIYQLERATSDSDAKLIDEKNGNNKEKTVKQRSMRRGSGAGSPNSQLSIPRYPAFDFSEQEDVNSMYPEPEANRTIKDAFQGLQKSETAIDTHVSKKKRDLSKPKTLMPEFMENSETESTKGSFECEASDLPSSTEVTSVSVPDIAFPSLPNTFLAKLGVHKDSPLPVEAFDEHDLESKFIALSLAFKTDCTTLCKRLALHQRQRDMAEKNVESECQLMRDHLNALNVKATNSDVRDLISKIQYHLDICQQAASRVSARSETYGAVQQEERVSRAFEVLVLHVDHLKRLFDKEHKELEETKRMLTDTRVFRKDGTTDVLSEDQKKYSKTFGLPVGSIKSVGRRRASVADFQSRSFLENCKSPGFSQSWTSGLNVKKLESLPISPVDSIVGFSRNSLSPTKFSTRISTSGKSSRRCSLPAANPTVPNNLQSPKVASDESYLSVSLFPQKSFCVKNERTSWTRKLSSVTDEKELSEDDSEPFKSHYKPKIENRAEGEQEKFMLKDFLRQVERKNSMFHENFGNGFDELPIKTDSVDKIYDFILHFNKLNYVKNTLIEKSFYIPAMQEIWQQNSPYTIFRYFCSTILAFVALCFLFSFFLPIIGTYLNCDLMKNIVL